MSTDFWVIFDTCSLPAYYRDVHNVLALPSRATVTYNYREQYLSADAKHAADRWARPATDEAAPRVLLVYGQTKGFKQGDDFNSAVNAHGAQPVWIPTRLGQLANVQVQSAKYYFRIKLAEYPRVDAIALNDLIHSLGADNPLTPNPGIPRWISLSSRHDLYAALASQRRDPSEQWHDIVSTLQHESQFSADSFWKLSNPVTVRLRQQMLPTNCPEDDEYNVGLLYKVEHEREVSFGVENLEPRNSGGPSAKPRTITAIANSQSLRVSPAETELRPYAVRSMRIRARSEELFGESEYTMRLSTGIQTNEWPVGATFTCRFQVKKNRSQLIAGIIFGLLGAGAIYWSSHFVSEASPPGCKWIGLGVFLLGVASLSASSYMLYRQLRFEVGG